MAAKSQFLISASSACLFVTRWRNRLRRCGGETAEIKLGGRLWHLQWESDPRDQAEVWADFVLSLVWASAASRIRNIRERDWLLQPILNSHCSFYPLLFCIILLSLFPLTFSPSLLSTLTVITVFFLSFYLLIPYFIPSYLSCSVLVVIFVSFHLHNGKITSVHTHTCVF